MTVLAKDRSALGNNNNNNNNNVIGLQRLESEEMRRYRANIEDYSIGKDSSNKRKPFLAG